jgi:hypothetical protein
MEISPMDTPKNLRARQAAGQRDVSAAVHNDALRF